MFHVFILKLLRHFNNFLYKKKNLVVMLKDELCICIYIYTKKKRNEVMIQESFKKLTTLNQS